MTHPAPDRYFQHALQWEGVLRACLHRYTPNAADVDELLQDTYARLLVAGRQSQTEVKSVRAFALTVARNVALDWLRHRRVVSIDHLADLEALEVLDEHDQVDEIVNTHQELALLSAAVAALPDKCRQVFTLRRVYELSHEQIASRLNISTKTVEQHMMKALRRCAQALAGGMTPQPRALGEKAGKEKGR